MGPSIAGKPVAFKLMPANTQPLLAEEGSTAYTRAGFARNSLWVTQADDSHRWPGGDYPLQNPNPGGLQDWVEEVRPLSKAQFSGQPSLL